MILQTTAKIVLNVVRQSKMRAFLTMLGIIIGIAAVIIVISAGAGAQSLILNQIKSLGTDVLGIMPGGSEEEGPPASIMGITITTLTYEDIKALLDDSRAPHVVAVNAAVQGVTTFTWGSNKYDGSFLGATDTMLDVEKYEVVEGNWFTEGDLNSLNQVIVLGSEAKNQIFGDSNAIGEKVKFEKKNFRVIGIMEERGVSGFTNFDNYVYVPLTTAQKLLLGINHVSQGSVKLDNEKNAEQSIVDIEMILRDRHNITNSKEDDFTVRSPKEALAIITSVTDALRFFLAAIAGIALVVGGIGIMNTMLVAVKERIHEIGIRKAMGAKNRDVMYQFLLESVFFTLFGGIVGIILGAAVSILVALVVRYLGYDWDLLISIESVVVATGVSAIIGLVFGVYPARKAAKLDPMTALRYE